MTNNEETKIDCQDNAISSEEQVQFKAELEEMNELEAEHPPKRIRRLRAEIDDLKIERDHLFKSTVIAESLVSQLVNLLHETENKRLAALIMSGDIDAHAFEDRRAKAAHELRSRVSILRNRAQDAANNLSNAQRPR